MPPSTVWIILVLVLVLVVGFFALTMIPTENGDPVICLDCLPGGRHHHHASEGGNPSTMLKQLSSAQAEFRSNDRDLDGRKQFWRADVAGLYALAPGGGPAIQLIQKSLALADHRPPYHHADQNPHRAVRGYWYGAVRHSDEDPKALDPDRFAFCAFPARPG